MILFRIASYLNLMPITHRWWIIKSIWNSPFTSQRNLSVFPRRCPATVGNLGFQFNVCRHEHKSNKLMFFLRTRTERQANPTLEDEINNHIEVDELRISISSKIGFIPVSSYSGNSRQGYLKVTSSNECSRWWNRRQSNRRDFSSPSRLTCHEGSHLVTKRRSSVPK